MACQPSTVYESPGSRKSVPVSYASEKLANVFPAAPPLAPVVVVPSAAFPPPPPPPPHAAPNSAMPTTRADALSRNFARRPRVNFGTSQAGQCAADDPPAMRRGALLHDASQ